MSFEQGFLRLLATGIGSVPYLDIEATCRDIISYFPRIPYWPQFVRRSRLEDMTIQFTESLPLLEIDKGSKALILSTDLDREKELVRFYDHFLAEDVEYFSISEEYAPGLHMLLELLSESTETLADQYIKGQVVGPITFAASIKGPDGKAVIHDTEILEAMVNGICMKALWQIRRLSSTGRKPILFMDEPYLSGFGSAFSAISREKVIQILATSIMFLKERVDVLVGIHCCGNTDWAMLLDTKPDIINFDAYGYMDYFLLYAAEIGKFLERGGHIAWGIVPTSEFTGKDTVESLELRLREGANRLVASGIDKDLLWASSMLTPSCGMGTMSPEAALQATRILSELSEKLRKEQLQLNALSESP